MHIIRNLTFLLALGVAGGLPQQTLGQATSTDIQRQTIQVRQQADAIGAELLSPRNYQQGIRLFERAAEEQAQGKNPDKVYARYIEAGEYFKAAMDNAELARVTFRAPLEARLLAEEARAYELATADWVKAEQRFLDATLQLEKGGLDKARNLAAEADTGYRLAELNAVRTLILAETWQLIARAESADADRYAPATIGRARKLLAGADGMLQADRYETAEPVRLAASASDHALHAEYLSGQAERVRRGELTVEEIILQWESAVTAIGESAGVTPVYSLGQEQPAVEIVGAIEAIQTDRSRLVAELEERNRQVIGLEEEIRELDTRLGGASAERELLVIRLEAQERVREQFRQVEYMFTEDEALVLRESDDIILRLVGLSFPSGSARVGESGATLLGKVHDAIEIFPQCDVVVEGHTDSAGADDLNMSLSEERADAVMNFMVTDLRVPAHRIRSAAYGETRPVANNETATGRARNRRIDVIIQPKLAVPGY